MTRWLSVAEAARRLGLDRKHVQRLIYSGHLPAVRAGAGRGIYRITEADVAAYKQARRTP